MTVIGLGFGTTAMLRGKAFLRRAHAYMERCVDELEQFIDETPSIATSDGPASCAWPPRPATSSAFSDRSS